MRKHYNTFDLAMMKRDGLSCAEISAKTGIDEDEVRARIRHYHRQGVSFAAESHQRHKLKDGKSHSNSGKHPERNSQYAEKGEGA